MRFHHIHGTAIHQDYMAVVDVTVTIALEPDGSGGYWYGVAYCAPGDQWSRKLGRAIAAGRCSKRRRAVMSSDASESIALALSVTTPCRWSAVTWDLAPPPADTLPHHRMMN